MEGFRSVDVYHHCNKNHAAKLGRHGTEGCREFFPKQGSLKCEVCGCHRNFHLKNTILVESEPLVNQDPKENDRPRRIRFKNQARKQTPGTLLKNQGLKQTRKPRLCYTEAEKIRLADYAERHRWRMRGKKGDRSELKSLCAELGLLEKQVGDWMYPRKKKKMRYVGH